MADEIRIDSESETDEQKREEPLRAKARALLAEIERADLEHGVLVIPRYWELGATLALLSGTVRSKYPLAGGSYKYHIARQVLNHFPSLAEAEAFQGSLGDFLRSLEGDEKPSRRTIEKLVQALMKAAKGNGRRVLRTFIKQGYWKTEEVSEWLQSEELEARRRTFRAIFSK